MTDGGFVPGRHLVDAIWMAVLGSRRCPIADQLF